MILSTFNKVSIRYDATVRTDQMIKLHLMMETTKVKLKWSNLYNWCFGLGKEACSHFRLYVTPSCQYKLTSFKNWHFINHVMVSVSEKRLVVSILILKSIVLVVLILLVSYRPSLWEYCNDFKWHLTMTHPTFYLETSTCHWMRKLATWFWC